MTEHLRVNYCRIVPPERLSDRFLISGTFSRSEDGSLKDEVILAYVLEVNQPMFSSSHVFPTIIATLEEQYPTLTPGDSLDSQFELVLRNLNQRLNALSESGETDWIGNLNGMVLVLSEEQLHFSETGHCPAYLLQNNRIRQISDSTGEDKDPHPLKTFANLASGKLEADEYILVANHELYNEISLDALRRTLHQTSPYAASSAISKHLKKERNSAVASIILYIEESEAPYTEPKEIFMDEVMESSYRKIGRRLMPVWRTVSSATKQTVATTNTAAKAGIAYTAGTVAPKLAELSQTGAKAVRETVATHASKKRKDTAIPVLDRPVVERILPKALRDAEQDSPAPDEAVEPAADTPDVEQIIPASEFEFEQEAPSPPTHEAQPKKLTASNLRGKLQALLGKKKQVALASAAILIVLIGGTVVRSRHNTVEVTKNTQNQDIITKAAKLEEQISRAVNLKQETEASRKVEEARVTLAKASKPTSAQKKQIDEIAIKLNLYSDQLSKTTRLSSPTATYTMPGNSNALLADLPYFFGTPEGNKNGTLLRTGKGEARVTQAVLQLPDPEDPIISLASATEEDTAGLALTRRSKVYRIVQESDKTFIRSIKPDSGNFPAADAIQSYAGNIYLLDCKSGLLWKYTNTGTSYSKGTSIINATKYNIKDSVSLAIDGDIYILMKNGTLQKFTSGKLQDNFSLKGLPYLSQKIILPRQVVTSQALDHIYVLDGGLTSSTTSTAKILVFGKDGTFVNQFAFPDTYTDVKAFAIDADQKTVWVLNNKEIGEFALP